MKPFLPLACAVGIVFTSAVLTAGQNAVTSTPDLPPWAYPVASSPAPAMKDDGTIFHVPNSTVGMTLTQARDAANAPDWHPDEHPPMPDVVQHGRAADKVRACGYCHYPNGLGRPENANVAGLPVNYFIQQVKDFKAGLRSSSSTAMRPPQLMIDTAKTATDADVRIAAEYFASLKPRPWTKVIESATAPKTEVIGGMLTSREDGSSEPLGDRIIEVPLDRHTAEHLRDSQSSFVAYVPVGSIKKGEVLATTGGAEVVDGKAVPGRTMSCAICHGPNLTGLGDVPPIAGRSPSYFVRQVIDIQRGHRNGPGAQLMKPVVAKLTMSDIVALAAYVASLPPTTETQ